MWSCGKGDGGGGVAKGLGADIGQHLPGVDVGETGITHKSV